MGEAHGFNLKIDFRGDRYPHTLSLNVEELDSVMLECDRITGYEHHVGRSGLEDFVCRCIHLF